MARDIWRSGNLSAGNFYGAVPQRRLACSSIMSEVVHRDAVDVPEHSHELAYFTFVLGGAYYEKFGRQAAEHQPMTVLWHRAGITHTDRIANGGARFFMVEVGHEAMMGLRQHSHIHWILPSTAPRSHRSPHVCFTSSKTGRNARTLLPTALYSRCSGMPRDIGPIARYVRQNGSRALSKG